LTILPTPWISLGVDDLLDTLPPSLMDAGVGVAFGQQGGVKLGEGFSELEAAWLTGIAAMARAGVRIIIDDVFLGGAKSQERVRKHLGGLEVFWVGVRCDAEVAAARELARGDRVIGMAVSQATGGTRGRAVRRRGGHHVDGGARLRARHREVPVMTSAAHGFPFCDAQARGLAKRVGSGWPATVMVVFVFCIVRPTRNAYPDATARPRTPRSRASRRLERRCGHRQARGSNRAGWSGGSDGWRCDMLAHPVTYPRPCGSPRCRWQQPTLFHSFHLDGYK
jgi:chloramphenicol 3-O phosphotransferase